MITQLCNEVCVEYELIFLVHMGRGLSGPSCLKAGKLQALRVRQWGI